MTSRRLPWGDDVFLADFHIHSRFSRATSPDMRPERLARVAKQKGIAVVGTGDFTHPAHLAEIAEDLEPDGATGLSVCRAVPEGPRFILTAEVANIFTQGGRNRRIHSVLFAPDLAAAREIQGRLAEAGNVASDGRPIFGFPVKELVRMVMDVSPQSLVVPAHVWTPWFSLFGAMSGFDSLVECFQEQSHHIHALETGLSSDPQMNWRLSGLDGYTLISNSDAHSPSKLGREANVLSCPRTYADIVRAIKDPALGFEGTLEFFPEEGKYHYDGHRACGVCMRPSETLAHNGLCPACGQPVTVGVLHRVEQLADRRDGFVPPNARPCVHLIPLEEIIAEAFGLRGITARVRREYQRLVHLAGSEMRILLWAEEAELARFVPERVLEGIRRMRSGRVKIRPGHDGVYGEIRLFSTEERLQGGCPGNVDKGGGGATQMRLF